MKHTSKILCSNCSTVPDYKENNTNIICSKAIQHKSTLNRENSTT